MDSGVYGSILLWGRVGLEFRLEGSGLRFKIQGVRACGLGFWAFGFGVWVRLVQYTSLR